MKTIKYLLIWLFALLGWSESFAQSVVVEAKIDSTSMLIGEQRKITIQVIHPQSVSVNFPIISRSDTLIPGIEVLSTTPLDTTIEDGARIKIKQECLVTSFDTGKYVIPAFVFTGKTKEYTTEKIFLNVSTIEADFEKAQIKDIEANYDPGINWKRLFLYLSIILLLAGIGYIVYYVINYIKKNKQMEAGEYVEVDNRLPHEIALDELNEIKEEKVWKQGQTKQYYTNITDTLREYFEKRFNISAMEMTSSEIIDSLKYNNDAAPVLDRMKQIFSTSDMVKFAKQEPTQEENEMSIVNAYFIVNQTTVIPTETEQETKANDESKSENVTE